MKIFKLSFLGMILLLAGLFSCTTSSTKEGSNTAATDSTHTNQVVNVYSHRHYESDIQLFEKFKKETGIEVKVVKAGADQLTQRLEMEGANSPADILITVDAGRLYRAKEKGLLQPVESPVLTANVPASLRDPQGYWFGLTYRARVIIYSKDRVKPEQVSTYEQLTESKWKGKLLMRPSENIYNQSLLASFVGHNGEEAAKQWAAGIVKNLAREPKGDDEAQISAIAKGEGDLSIVNSYYVGKMMNSSEQAEKDDVAKIGVIFPNQQTTGTHINISGAGITKYSPNKANAIKLLEFLVSDEAQRIYAETNQEYPVKAGVAASANLQSLGTFRADTLGLSALGKYNTAAVKIFDQAGWK